MHAHVFSILIKQVHCGLVGRNNRNIIIVLQLIKLENEVQYDHSQSGNFLPLKKERKSVVGFRIGLIKEMVLINI